jgi:hypothetical protein
MCKNNPNETFTHDGHFMLKFDILHVENNIVGGGGVSCEGTLILPILLLSNYLISTCLNHLKLNLIFYVYIEFW